MCNNILEYEYHGHGGCGVVCSGDVAQKVTEAMRNTC